MTISWENEIASLLNELTDVQSNLLALLAEKQQALIAGDFDALDAMADREQEISARLQGCLDVRQGLLSQAAQEGKPADSIRSLAVSLDETSGSQLQQNVDGVAADASLLRHQSLTQWVVVQRSLIHLSQMLELIATKGRMRPTYGKGESALESGSMVDQAA